MLGIGGGLIFAPVLLWLNLPPHQALATSSFAIVPTALAGTIVHLQSGSLPTRSALAIGLAGFGSALIFGGLGGLAAGWMLLAMQTAVYVLLAFSIKEAPKAETNEDAETDEAEEKIEDAEIEQELEKPLCLEPEETPAPLLAGVGCIAGWTAGMLGLGGGTRSRTTHEWAFCSPYPSGHSPEHSGRALLSQCSVTPISARRTGDSLDGTHSGQRCGNSCSMDCETPRSF